MAIKNNQKMENTFFRVIVFGDPYVGKDKLLRSLCHSKEAAHKRIWWEKTVCVYGKHVRLEIWNSSSLNMYFPSSKAYKTYSLGAMVVYDVTSRVSFERIHSYIGRFGPETIVMLLGNKCDMTNCRKVTKEEGEKLAAEKGFRFLEISAKNGINVEEAFTYLAGDILLRPKFFKEFEKVMSSTNNSSDDVVAKFVKAGRKLLTNLENSTFRKVLRYSVEKNYHIRAMLVGNEGVGKSTLLKRLLKLPVKINKYDSTNGIDVHVHSCDIDIETGAWCVNEIHETGLTGKAKFWRYLGAANTTRTNEAPAEHRSFHMRVAKMLTNTNLLTRETIENERGSVSVQMEKDSMTDSGDKNNEQTTTGEVCDVCVMSDDHDDNDTAFVAPVLPSIDLDDVEPIIAKTKSLVTLKENPKARVDFYDFAGQLVFHASHPTFLSSKAIYILTFNLHKILSDRRAPKVEKVKTKKTGKANQGTVSDVDSIFFWLNIVYMFAATKRHIHPHVILVGTHADKLPKANRDQVAEMCFREIRSLLADSPLKHILSDKEFVVDNTKKTDPCFSQLQAEIFALAQQQPNWGIQTPSRWLPLEREIQHAKDSGLKVIPIGKIREINSRLEVRIPDDAELQRFLQFLHDTGEMIFFNEPTLRDRVVLDPVWLIDALKALITADRFAIRSTNHADKWKRFCETGIIHKTTITAIFKENADDPALVENSEHVLRLMEKFLFIASPIDNEVDINDHGDTEEKTDTMYIVSSMVQTPMNKQLITSPQGLSSTTVFCMVSQNNFLPSAVFHKLLAKCISKWQIVDQSGQKQIFCDVCKFNLDQQKHYKLILLSIQHALHARIISYIDTTKPRLSLCKLVYDFLIETLRNILRSMGFSDEFRTCIQCPRFSTIKSGGYLDTDLMDNQEFITCDECQVSHVMYTSDLIDCWTDKGSTLSDDEPITPMQNPTKDVETEKHTNEDTDDTLEGTNIEQSLFDAPITQGHLNHARVCNALVTVCADGLRDILQSQIPTGCQDFYQLLKAKKPVLTGMRNLRQEQLDILFPDPRGKYTGTVDQFDITLLYTLIRNISTVPPPVTGWGKAPVDNPRDTSLGAATERIRICRNCVSGHSMDGRLDDQSFEHYWKDIGLIMDDIENSLGAKEYQDALKKRKDQILSPAEAQSLRANFSAFQADVLAAANIAMEAVRNLKSLAEGHI